MASRDFEFITGPETATLPTITTPFDASSGVTSQDNSGSSQTVASGKSLTHANLNILAAHTYTINGSLIVHGAKGLTVNGELNLTGGELTVN